MLFKDIQTENPENMFYPNYSFVNVVLFDSYSHSFFNRYRFQVVYQQVVWKISPVFSDSWPVVFWQ
jgi:hypothetical protein